MRRSIGAILGILLVIEIGVAIAIVAAQPEGFGSLANFGVGPERRQAQPTQTFDVSGQPTNLIVNNGNGRVTINGDANATALVVNAVKIVYGKADNAFNRLNYQVTKDGNTVNVKVERPEPNVGFNLDRIEITITAPKNIATTVGVGSGDVLVNGLDSQSQNLDFSSGSGSISLTNTNGSNIKVRTGSGDVKLVTVNGAVDAQTGSGSISVNGVTGSTTRLKTGSGDVRIDSLNAGLDAETNSGSIRATNATVSSLRLKTGSGDVRFNGQATLNGDAQATTGSGEVELTFTNLSNPPRFDISTGSGDINFNVKGVSGQLTNNKHSLTTNNNGPLFRISTGSGDVRVNG